ncbi:hypothetical protein CK203_098815 [Vitis vinifera]|uniref:Reverse transcriptase zinc-binding domain-containing protein n=1 Tax=Vitis vinifera TaxID=29760 RepID=A0A438D481_VITVI|nr:hypothetical protein CK203_098815 [Vitis vinifera]
MKVGPLLHSCYVNALILRWVENDNCSLCTISMEVEEAESFLERLHGKRVLEDVEDMVSWFETKSGKFSFKSLYFALEAGCSFLFPSSYIWNVNVQPKISFFAWEAMWGKTLTLDMVQKRGWALANRCFMCLEKEETIDHLLLHCSKTRVYGI